jgi:hypothetical protein
MTGFVPDGIEHFTSLSLLPGFDRSDYQDRFRGKHHGCDFAFFDGHLERKVRTNKSTSWRTVFRGQLICIDFPKKFLGTTVVRRDKGLFNFMDRWSTSLQRVGLGDSRLEKAFEVYADDQVEARYLIHPVFMERLLDLETQFKGKNLRCAFFQGQLLVAIEGGDKFEMGSMFRTLLDEVRDNFILMVDELLGRLGLERGKRNSMAVLVTLDGLSANQVFHRTSTLSEAEIKSQLAHLLGSFKPA